MPWSVLRIQRGTESGVFLKLSLMPPPYAAHMSWDNYFAIADLSYHVPPTFSRELYG